MSEKIREIRTRNGLKISVGEDRRVHIRVNGTDVDGFVSEAELHIKAGEVPTLYLNIPLDGNVDVELPEGEVKYIRHTLTLDTSHKTEDEKK